MAEHFPTPVVKVLRCLGIGMIIWFPIVFTITFAVPAARFYNMDPVFGEKQAPDAKLIAFHWMTMIGGILVGIACALSLNMYTQCFSLLGTGLFWMLWYFLYIGYFYTSQAYLGPWQVLSVDAFNEMDRQTREKGPEIELFGRAVSHGRRSRTDCETRPAYLDVDTFTSYTEPMNLTEEQLGDGGLIIQTTIKVNLVGEDDSEVLEKMKNEMKNCMASWDIGTLDIKEPRWAGGSSQFKKRVIVTKDGTTPSVLRSKSNARTAGFFAAGLIYSYDFARTFPRTQYSMVWTATLNETQEFDCGSVEKACWGWSED